jgi:hypothetical protein
LAEFWYNFGIFVVEYCLEDVMRISFDLGPNRQARLDKLTRVLEEDMPTMLRLAIDALYEKHFPDQAEIEDWNERYGLNERAKEQPAAGDAH